GTQGGTGLSRDDPDSHASASKGDATAKLALDLLIHSVHDWIAAYLAQLNRADALVFTAGIGENRAELRETICANLDQLGIVLDSQKNNATKTQEAIIRGNS